MEPRVQKFDVILFGGGIAGLWTLAQLRKAGLKAILFENRELGGTQSIASQGIIHGGTKYALTGKWTDSANNISDMPKIWSDCLNGNGHIDLSDVEVLTRNQLLWSESRIISGLTSFFSTSMMNSRIGKIPSSDYPDPFNTNHFKGSIFKLNEPVINVASLMESLVKKVQSYCFLLPEIPLMERNKDTWFLELPNGQKLESKRLVLTAGQGNQRLLREIGRKKPNMQERPLHMLLLKGDLPPLFAHCLGANSTPKLTITSSPNNHEMIWYVGGQLAESGVNLSREELILSGKREIESALPWLSFSEIQWGSLEISRAEVKHKKGIRPENSFVQEADGLITCWPTKLTLAPNLADKVIKAVSRLNIDKTEDQSFQINLPVPSLSKLPWQKELKWS